MKEYVLHVLSCYRKRWGGGDLCQSMETAVLRPASVGHVTGYPSVWWGRQHVSVVLCHTPLHTQDHISHILKTLPHLIQHSEQTALRIMLPCLRSAVVLGLLQVHCITAALGKCPPPRLQDESKNLMSIWTSSTLFCFRQRLFPDLQREPQQVHQGGKCHLNNGGPVWSSCQRTAVSLGFRIPCPEPQAPTLSGSHRHYRLGKSHPLWMWWKHSTPALGVQERHPLWSEGQGPALKLGQ